MPTDAFIPSNITCIVDISSAYDSIESIRLPSLVKILLIREFMRLDTIVIKLVGLIERMVSYCNVLLNNSEDFFTVSNIIISGLKVTIIIAFTICIGVLVCSYSNILSTAESHI